MHFILEVLVVLVELDAIQNIKKNHYTAQICSLQVVELVLVVVVVVVELLVP
jgi:hypothetical protein